jgi:hypothetical protein
LWGSLRACGFAIEIDELELPEEAVRGQRMSRQAERNEIAHELLHDSHLVSNVKLWDAHPLLNLRPMPASALDLRSDAAASKANTTVNKNVAACARIVKISCALQ